MMPAMAMMTSVGALLDGDGEGAVTMMVVFMVAVMAEADRLPDCDSEYDDADGCGNGCDYHSKHREAPLRQMMSVVVAVTGKVKMKINGEW